MVKRIVTTCLAMAAMTVALCAQEKPAGPAAAQTKPPAAAAPADVKRRNVSIELAITDQTGSAEPVKKVVTLIVTDRQTGSVRSSETVVAQSPAAREAGVTQFEGRSVTLNVDATPIIHADDSIMLSLTAGRAQLNERMGVTLESGRPLVISRSANPASTRKITVELTATVMK